MTKDSFFLSNAVQTGYGFGALAGSYTTADRAGTGLSESQFDRLMNVLGSNSVSTSNPQDKCHSDWILDIGASFHMTGEMTLLSNLMTVSSSTIVLPDGTSNTANKAGKLCLSDRFVLRDVLFVPNLTCNLISFAQLLRDHNCIARLTDKLCILQDRTSMSLIGAGEERNGIYWFRVGLQTAHVSRMDVVSPALWHSRVGHPSLSVLQTLSHVKINGSLEPCDSCHRAKQSRPSFPISQTNASDIFELIHCDVWSKARFGISEFSPGQLSLSLSFVLVFQMCFRFIHWFFVIELLCRNPVADSFFFPLKFFFCEVMVSCEEMHRSAMAAVDPLSLGVYYKAKENKKLRLPTSSRMEAAGKTCECDSRSIFTFFKIMRDKMISWTLGVCENHKKHCTKIVISSKAEEADEIYDTLCSSKRAEEAVDEFESEDSPDYKLELKKFALKNLCRQNFIFFFQLPIVAPDRTPKIAQYLSQVQKFLFS